MAGRSGSSPLYCEYFARLYITKAYLLSFSRSFSRSCKLNWRRFLSARFERGGEETKALFESNLGREREREGGKESRILGFFFLFIVEIEFQSD